MVGLGKEPTAPKISAKLDHRIFDITDFEHVLQEPRFGEDPGFGPANFELDNLEIARWVFAPILGVVGSIPNPTTLKKLEKMVGWILR